MADKFLIKAYINNGVIEPLAPRAFKEVLAFYNMRNVWILFEPALDRRSNQQNKYYWGVVIQTLLRDQRFEGWFPDELHESLLEKFATEVDILTGLGRTKRSKKMSTMEFKEYVERIQIWASMELNIYIPDPVEYDIWADVLDDNNISHGEF